MAPFRYIFIIGLGITLLAGTPSREKVRWVVQKTSTLSIEGHTNVNRFSCSVNEYTEPDTITCLNTLSPNDPQGIPLRGILRIQIEDFDCHNRVMTGEFKKTLKYKQYPQLKVCFINLEKMPFAGNNTGTIKGNVDIELAGVIRRFEIDYAFCRTDASELKLIGTRCFRFTDFQMEPPRKMGGIIRVNDELNVQFILYLKQMN